jgi:insulysin
MADAEAPTFRQARNSFEAPVAASDSAQGVTIRPLRKSFSRDSSSETATQARWLPKLGEATWNTVALVIVAVICTIAFGALVQHRHALVSVPPAVAAPVVPAATPTIPSRPATTTSTPQQIVRKPKSDLRNYQYETLSNGLRVISVQDPASKTAAMSMAVNAGSYDNPKEFPGLAHFCEHMLFLGTKQFPEAGDFDKFMSKAGGSDNAFTEAEKTVYFGELSAAWSDEGLKRFGDFFRAPLFNDKFVSKEVNAIDSEHAKNVQSGSQRIIEIFNSLANPDSPIGRFSTGDVETLITEPQKKGLNIVEGLKEWFKSHYCPSRMILATFGPDSLEKQLARARSVSDITAGSPECAQERHSFALPAPWPQSSLGKFLEIQGIDPQPQVWMHFPLPNIKSYYRSGAMSYISYVLTYGGEGGLVRVLQDKLGYVTSLDFSSDGGSYGTDAYIIASFTEAGLKNYESVLDLIFYYIAMLNSQGVDMELYQSLADANNLEWDWSEPSSPSNTVSGLSEKGFQVPLDELLTGGSRIEAPNATLVKDLLSRINPNNMNMGVATQATLPNTTDVQTLAHYGARFKVSDLQKRFGSKIDQWHKANPTLTTDPLRIAVESLGKTTKGGDWQLPVVPRAIKGVPKDISTVHMAAKVTTGSSIESLYGERPQSIEDGEAKLLYREGWLAKSPKVQLQVDFEIPRGADSWQSNLVDNFALSFYNSLMSEELAPKVYDLSMTGVSYYAVVSKHQVSFGFGGFTPLIPQLMDKVLAAFDAGVSVADQSRFNRLVAETREDLNTFSDMPYQYASEDRGILFTPGASSRKEKLQALDHVTADMVASSVNRLLKPQAMEITGLAMGNTGVDDAHKSFNQIRDRLKTWAGHSKKALEGERVRRVVPVLKLSAPVEVRRLNQRPGDQNDATVVSIQVGESTIALRAILGLISSVLGQVAYDYLRTNLQLGYVVSGGISKISNIHVISAVVQGEKLKADAAQGAMFKVFSDVLPTALAKMTDDEFESYKSSLKEELNQPPSSPSDELGFFWSKIKSDEDCWGLQDSLLQYLAQMKDKSVLLETWNQIMSPTEGTRRILTVKHFAKAVPSRPSLDESKKIWQEQGVPPQAMKLLEREYNAAITLDDVSSLQREQLLTAGNASYWPTGMGCQAGVAASPEATNQAPKKRLTRSVNLRGIEEDNRLIPDGA